MPQIDPHRPLWYRRYRGAAYLSAFAALVWTVAIVLPFAPFSYLPPIIVGGGPGVWFLFAYILFLVVGIAGFGALSAFLTTVELHEGRSIDSRLMWPALALLSFGFVVSCALLAWAGYIGGYASTFGGASVKSIDSLLSPYEYPVMTTTLITVVGAGLALVSMIRARWPMD